MKKRFSIMATLVVGLGFTSCSVDVDTSGLDDLEEQLEKTTDEMEEEMDKAEEETESSSFDLYQCPTDCENGPAYPNPGPCKTCGEEMVVI
ncbi:MAG: hypothetical protein P8P74_16500 [Crocinitomicaceae bacterium]|nr:hypothetical protein [Crocinitomicaceae bacterium]